MMTRRSSVWILGVPLVALLAVPHARVSAVPQSPPRAAATMPAVMRTKLTNAQNLLAAVMTRDYAGIDRTAEQLSRISEMEIGSWQSQPKPAQYAEQAVAFLTAVQDLRRAAQGRDMDAAGAAYASLTTSCVTCHKHVRDVTPRPAIP